MLLDQIKVRLSNLEMRKSVKTYVRAFCHLSSKNHFQSWMKRTQIFHLWDPVSWLNLCPFLKVYPISCLLFCKMAVFYMLG